jgi:ankyrin repeat protein
VDINIQNAEGESPLFIAIRHKFFEMAKYLLSENACISAGKKELATLLCRAAAENDLVTIRLVVEGKGDMECVDAHGHNFREVAEKHRRGKILSYLKTI